jgi:hypothetical protein
MKGRQTAYALALLEHLLHSNTKQKKGKTPDSKGTTGTINKRRTANRKELGTWREGTNDGPKKNGTDGKKGKTSGSPREGEDHRRRW